MSTSWWSTVRVPSSEKPVVRRVLILGGTSEAVALAKALATQRPDLDVITSLAGVTRRPTAVPGSVRTGGFGGAAGLAAYLCSEHVDAVIDATHPFATQIAANAAAACADTSAPRLKLLRAMWAKAADDNWIEVADAVEAAAKLGKMNARSVFVTLGLRDLHHFAGLKDVRFVVRLIEQPSSPLPIQADVMTGRGPSDEAADLRLMKEQTIDTLVTKASGGASTEGKILAARALGLPVVMIRRPKPPDGEIVDSVQAAFGWLESQLAMSR